MAKAILKANLEIVTEKIPIILFKGWGNKERREKMSGRNELKLFNSFKTE